MKVAFWLLDDEVLAGTKGVSEFGVPSDPDAVLLTRELRDVGSGQLSENDRRACIVAGQLWSPWIGSQSWCSRKARLVTLKLGIRQKFAIEGLSRCILCPVIDMLLRGCFA
jgi:hypothetical protein